MGGKDGADSREAGAAPRDVLNRRQLLAIAGTAVVLLFGGFYVSSMLSQPSATDTPSKQVRVALKKLRFVRAVAGPIAYTDGVDVFVTRNGAQWLALDQRCPHMQCAVAWNAGQGHFVCPCHGSVFDRYGNVIHGPAARGMYHHQVRSESDVLVIDGLV